MGAANTVIEAFDVLPVPPSVELTVTLLFLTPMLVPCTLTDTVQLALPPNVPPERLTEPEPETAVAVPPQVLVRLAGLATTRPAGRLSVNEIPVAELLFGLLMLKLKVVVPFNGMVAAPKLLVMETGLATVKLADAVFPVPPLVEVTAPVVFVYWPDAAPVTVTLNWHWLFALIVAPDNAIPVGAVVVNVPPQTVLVLLATVKPEGNVSVNATPLRATVLATGLVIVKVSEVVAFNAIVAGLNALAIEGGATTVTLAEAAVPLPPSFELTALVVLFFNPAVVLVTFTLKVHELLAARVAPDRLIALVFCVAVMVPPPQLPVNPFGVEMMSPAGRVSVKPTPVSATGLELLMVKLRLVDPFSGMLDAPKALLMLGGPTTVSEALEVLPVPPLVEETGTLLFFAPPVVPCTFTETVQEDFGATLAPLKETEDDPFPAVAVPPQVLLRFAGVATTSPAGKLSVNATPFSVRFWLLLLSTAKVRLVVPLSGIVVAPKALTM